MTPTDRTPPVVLSVAGTDSGGAAGLAADLATFGHLGTHGACVVTAVTAQDTTGVRAIHEIPVAVVAAQLDAVLDDLPVAAMKTGMLGSAEVVRLLGRRWAEGATGRPLVVDPVLVATSGAVLGDDAVVAAYREHLLPVATVVTPNQAEARVLTGLDGPTPVVAARLAELGCAVVLTGGPEWGPPGSRGAGPSDPVTCTDWLALPGEPAVPLRHRAVPTENDHGTGCTHSAALAAALAHGAGPMQAALAAAAYTTGRLATGATWRLGRGRGPVAHVAPTTDDPNPDDPNPDDPPNQEGAPT